ncbi:ABC transporter permease [Cellulosilyticum sp. I15G10I2]|uniref:ABC transporter permease n=1 Tax=Cellulosilyticum sp. I15G10I2 TaxID=1892843 RepID=UPI00085CB363|nr:ABC transporter permease [Cellulosilyticum sp. I15G10I2]
MIEFMTSFLASDIRTATPILIAGLGIVFSQRAGIVNIGIEGLMLIASLVGVIGSWLSGSVVVGVLFAIASSMVFSAIFAFFTITIKADQTVVGMAINIFAGGFTITLNRIIFGVNTSVPSVAVFNRVEIPYLSKLPVIGQAFFNQSIPVYFAFLAVPVAWFVMQKTDIGLKIRAVGENPRACDTVGIHVERMRYGAVLYSGLMAGIAGAFISMGQLSFFTEGMVAGRGFMALAAVVFGNYTPLGVMFAALLFGAGDALQYRLQAVNTGIPYQFLIMLPYIITIVALCGLIGKTNQPASSGVPYVKE